MLKFLMALAGLALMAGAAHAQSKAPAAGDSHSHELACMLPRDAAQTLVDCTAVIDRADTKDDVRAIAYLYRAGVRIDGADYAPALEDLNHGLALDGASQEVRSQLLEYRASVRAAQGDLKAARTDVDHAIDLSAENHRALLLRGRMKMAEKDYAGAQADLSAAEHVANIGDRNLSQIYLSEADLAATKGETDIAMNLYVGAIKLDDHNYDARLARANIMTDRGQYEQASTEIDALVVALPQAPSVLNSACWIRAAYLKRDFDKARAYCDAAIKASPHDGSIYDSVGLVALQQHRFQDAWTAYDNALGNGCALASCYFGRGVSAIKLGRAADGNADIIKAITLDPRIAQAYAGYGQTP